MFIGTSWKLLEHPTNQIDLNKYLFQSGTDEEVIRCEGDVRQFASLRVETQAFAVDPVCHSKTKC